jgi:hypothetical protein
VPVYATSLPPSASLRYAWRRGTVAGQAELHWQLDDRQYRLSLRTEAAGALNLAVPAAAPSMPTAWPPSVTPKAGAAASCAR